jgi:hypothetical protein
VGSGLERIEDSGELAAVRAQALRVLLESAAAAGAVALAVLLVW